MVLITENGWPQVGRDRLHTGPIPGTTINVPLQAGQPATILKAFAADYHQHVESLYNGKDDVGGWTPTNSVWNSNHLSGTAMDLNWSDHPFPLKGSFNANQIRTIREKLDWYEGMVYWGGDWTSPIDEMHWQMGYNTFNNPRTQEFIDRKIKPDGFSRFTDEKRSGIPPLIIRREPLNVLVEAMDNSVARDRYSDLLPAVQHSLKMCHCDNPNRVSMWFAQIGHESGGLRWMEEIASGSAYEGRTDLGNTQPGDGIRFKGRGPIQITGRFNYGKVSAWAHGIGLVDTPTYFVDNPSHLASDTYGFYGVIWYWTVARPNINPMSDNRDLEGVTRAINGGLNGLADRRTRWNRCIAMSDMIMDIFAEDREPPLSGRMLDMAQVPQEHWDQLRREVSELRSAIVDLVASNSRYRNDNEGARWQTVELIRNGDAMIHEQYAERLALLGDPWHVLRITRNARRGDPVAFAVFQRIPEEYLERNAIDWREVEKSFQAEMKSEPAQYKD